MGYPEVPSYQEAVGNDSQQLPSHTDAMNEIIQRPAIAQPFPDDLPDRKKRAVDKRGAILMFISLGIIIFTLLGVIAWLSVWVDKLQRTKQVVSWWLTRLQFVR